MSNENGTSTVAAIEDRSSTNGNESDSSGEGTYNGRMVNNNTTSQQQHSSSSSPSSPSRKKNKSKKRFLQLYTSKAYGNQRSKLVQPHMNDEYDEDEKKRPSASAAAAADHPTSPFEASSQQQQQQQQQQQMIVKRSGSFSMEDEEHVLSPRIVEAVTHSTQVVWANCQKTEGLLGRSDMKLQTAIGMPVGVDESGNVWVVVMFSPKNVASTSDAIEYLQYISRSAASTSIPCLLPVVGEPAQSARGSIGNNNNNNINNNNMITSGEEDGEEQTQCHSLISIKPQFKRPDTTRDLGDGVTAKFVSFNLNDDVEDEMNKSGHVITTRRPSLNNALKDAPKDDFGIPILPAPAQLNGRGASQQILDAIDNAITDAFDDASYGVWSTIMNSAGGDTVQTSVETIAAKMYLIQERLEEFANAFLGMSVFDIADAWTVSSYSSDGIAHSPVMKCLFTAAATESNVEINDFRKFSANSFIVPGDGAVGKAYSTGYPVWSSVKVSCMQLSDQHFFMFCAH